MHGRDAAHATIGFVGAALEQFRFARRFFRAGEHAAQHHARCARCDSFGDVAGVANAAVTNAGNIGFRQRISHILNRSNLRHADTGDDARRADRTGADTDFHTICTVIHQR